MQIFLGMILGALLLVAGVYISDTMSTSTVANGEVAQGGRTIVNWDVATPIGTRSSCVRITTGSGCRRNNRFNVRVRTRASVGFEGILNFNAAIYSPRPFAHRR